MPPVNDRLPELQHLSLQVQRIHTFRPYCLREVNGPERSFIANAANDRLTALLVVLILSGNPLSPLDLFENQFRHNDFPIGAFQQVMKPLIGILFAPMYYGHDLAGDEFRADRWRERF